jgi:hypothetical protein
MFISIIEKLFACIIDFHRCYLITVFHFPFHVERVTEWNPTFSINLLDKKCYHHFIVKHRNSRKVKRNRLNSKSTTNKIISSTINISQTKLVNYTRQTIHQVFVSLVHLVVINGRVRTKFKLWTIQLFTLKVEL